MSTLTLKKDTSTGEVIGVLIDGNEVPGFVAVAASLSRGVVEATIKARFDVLETSEQTDTDTDASDATTGTTETE